MTKKIFVDESGNPHIHNIGDEGCTKYFTFVAVRVEDDLELRKLIKGISNRYFNGKEVKGAYIGSLKRSVEILDDLHGFRFNYFGMSFEKKHLFNQFPDRDFKKFYKYCLKYFIRKCSTYFKEEYWEIDKFGNDEFADELNRVLNGKVDEKIPDTLKYKIVDSDKSFGVQLADIIANTIGATNEGKLKKPILEIIKGPCISNEYWPPKPHRNLDNKKIPLNDKYDQLVAHTALKLAYDFIDSTLDSRDDEVMAQGMVLQFLIRCAQDPDFNKFIISPKIIDSVKISDIDVKTDRQFMNKIIAPLRMAGVIIASSNDGYKLPTSVHDMHEFVKNVQSKILPYLDRMMMARRTFRSITNDMYDIVDLDSFPRLFKLISRE